MTPDQMIELMHLVKAGPDGLYESRTPAIPALCLPSVGEQDGSEGVASGYSGQPYIHQVLDGATQLPSPIAGAVLETWYPGQTAGTSLVDLLDGQADPSGKLPVTFPATEHGQPASRPATFGGDGGHTDYAEGIDVGYRWYEAHGVTPAFPFGFGLSYPCFAFSGLQVTGSAAAGLTVSATVTNVGNRDGADVVQCYVGDPAATGEPPRQLRAFRRVQLRAGWSTVVTLHITPGDLATWNGSSGQPGDWTVATGRYRVSVGDSSARAGLPLRTAVRPAGVDLGAGAGPTAVG